MVMNHRTSVSRNLISSFLVIFLIAELFAFAELIIIPAAYALSRWRESGDILSEMGLILHSLNSTTTWLNLAVYWLFAGIVFLMVIIPLFLFPKTRSAMQEPAFSLIGINLVFFFPLILSCYQACYFPVNFSRKLLFGLILLGVALLWLLAVRLFRKKVILVYIFLGSILIIIIHLAKALLILYKIEPGTPGIVVMVLGSILLIAFFIRLIGMIEPSRSRILPRLLQGFGVALLGFGLFVFLLPALAWRNYYFGRPSEKELKNRPNIIMIVMDTVRADHLSLYGYQRETTPFLDQLGQKSLVFEKAFSTSPWTLPSHASFFTGLLPSEHNCTYENLSLDAGFTTLAEILKKNGYFTIGWSNNPLLNYSSGLTQGFDRFVENNQLALYTGEILRKAWLNRFPQYVSDNGAQLTNRTVFRWLNRLSRGQRPFFLFLNYMEAHIPYPRDPKAYKFFSVPDHAVKKYPSPNWDLYNCEAEQQRQFKANAGKWYDGSIFYLDDQLSRVFEQMEKSGLMKNSIIIILSDHGESFGEHNWWGHGVNLYNTELQVPLIIFYPKILSPQRIRGNFSLKNLPELILKLKQAGTEQELLPWLQNPDPVFAEVFKPIMYIERMSQACPTGDLSWLNRRQKAIIQDSYKLIWDSRGIMELYNFEQNPEETDNLSALDRKSAQDLSREMNAFLKNHPLAPGAGKMDSATRNALKSLGYLK